jgi:hypothetical protein
MPLSGANYFFLIVSRILINKVIIMDSIKNKTRPIEKAPVGSSKKPKSEKNNIILPIKISMDIEISLPIK